MYRSKMKSDVQIQNQNQMFQFWNVLEPLVPAELRYHFLHLSHNKFYKCQKDESTNLLKTRQNKSGIQNKKMLIPQKNKIL